MIKNIFVCLMMFVIVFTSMTVQSLETGISALTLLDTANYFSTTALLSPTMGTAQVTVNAVPLPPAIFLFGSGAIGLFSFFRKISHSLMHRFEK